MMAPTPSSVESLWPLFRPRAVAVVGASRHPGRIGRRLFDALCEGGYPGPVYPVNPRAEAIGDRKAFASVRHIPGPVDLAVVCVPSKCVLGVVDDCAAKGVAALLVISAGFAEAGADGRRLQDVLLAEVRGHGMRMVGPNCLGLVSTDPAAPLNASFANVVPPAGRVAMSSDSGGLGLAVLAGAARLGLGISACVSVGNRADVSSNDLLEYWEHDDRTNVVLLYLESFGNPRRFARIARRVGRAKPIVAVKAGRTAAGQRAAGSHTAALATNDLAVDALFHQTGVIRADALEDMFDVAAALSEQPLPAGNRVAVLTNAGGPAILCADACEAGGLMLPVLSNQTVARLAAFLPPAVGRTNPVDLIASAGPGEFRQAVATLLTGGEVDSLIVITFDVGLNRPTEVDRAVAEGVAEARRAGATGRPVLVCRMPEPASRSLRVSNGEVIPVYGFPEAAARALARAVAYSAWRRGPIGIVPEFPNADPDVARMVCREALAARSPGWLTPDEVRHVLRSVRLPLARGGVARTADDAVWLAEAVGFPVAIKFASARLVHKSEVGGVRLNVTDAAGVRQAVEGFRDALTQHGEFDAAEGVLVQPMIHGGTELMAGVTHDAVFGPLVAFGLGGMHVEILGDVCFRVAPLTDVDADEMIHGIRGFRLLEGYRGHPPADVAALKDLLLRLACLAEAVPEIAELDLNPVFAMPPGQGCRIVDARLRVAKPVSPTEDVPCNPTALSAGPAPSAPATSPLSAARMPPSAKCTAN